MYDDKKYSPCYSGWTPDIQFIRLCELERDQHCSLGISTELSYVYVGLYRNLTAPLAP